MKKLILALTVCAVTTPQLAFALDIPKGGRYDNRVKFVQYNPADVVKIIGHYGFSTHLQFSQTEEILSIHLGDDLAWKHHMSRNHLFLKPIEDDADTNLTVITNKRAYNIELLAREAKNIRSNSMYFQVNFRYPDEEAAKRKAEDEAEQIRKKMNRDPFEGKALNWNYWGKGEQSISPTQIFDDGTFTYLTFPSNRSVPAVFAVDANGNESRVDFHMHPEKPGTMVIHQVAEQLVLRQGDMATCIFNRSWDSIGVTDTTGTTVPGVRRVIRTDE